MTEEFVGSCVPVWVSILLRDPRTTMDDPQLRRTRQRIGVAFGLVLLTYALVSAGQHRQYLLRHRRLAAEEHGERSLWSFFRRLKPLTEDEVNAIIFERHDEPYTDKAATFSPGR